ncbi:MAG: hypothetical protein QW038_01935 [Nanopusillaceae archaeon]
MKKRTVEIAFGTLAILLLVIIILTTILIYYFSMYSSGTKSIGDITKTVENQTVDVNKLIKNMTNISSIK